MVSDFAGGKESFREFLRAVSETDTETRFVLPADVLSKRLTQEIANGSGCPPVMFGIDESMASANELARFKISAERGKFAAEAEAVVNTVVEQLKERKASGFEIKLKRNDDEPGTMILGV